MFLKLYSNPKATGWKGWIESAKGEALAFVRLNGQIVWDWSK